MKKNEITYSKLNEKILNLTNTLFYELYFKFDYEFSDNLINSLYDEILNQLSFELQ